MHTPTVLAIHDAHADRELIRQALEADGARTLLASDAEQAESLANKHQPDVILIDMAPSSGHGLRLCRQLRTNPKLRDVPVLLVSSKQAAAEEQIAGLQSGPFGYLARPFSDPELLAQVSLLDKLHQTHQQLKRRNEELEASNRELAQFTRVVSHDLKEPLRTVAGYCQLLQRRYSGQLDAEADEFLRYAVDGARRMERLIDDLRRYCQVGKTDLQLVPTELGEVFAQAVANLELAIREAGAVIHGEPLPMVQGHPVMLVQLFQNLLANAIRFRSKSDPVIHVRSQSVDEGWQITVADNGVGIEPRHFERIFGLFQQLHPGGPGTGIGLALCKKIAQRHQGRIWVESQRGRGSQFHVALPAAISGLSH